MDETFKVLNIEWFNSNGILFPIVILNDKDKAYVINGRYLLDNRIGIGSTIKINFNPLISNLDIHTCQKVVEILKESDKIKLPKIPYEENEKGEFITHYKSDLQNIELICKFFKNIKVNGLSKTFVKKAYDYLDLEDSDNKYLNCIVEIFKMTDEEFKEFFPKASFKDLNPSIHEVLIIFFNIGNKLKGINIKTLEKIPNILDENEITIKGKTYDLKKTKKFLKRLKKYGLKIQETKKNKIFEKMTGSIDRTIYLNSERKWQDILRNDGMKFPRIFYDKADLYFMGDIPPPIDIETYTLKDLTMLYPEEIDIDEIEFPVYIRKYIKGLKCKIIDGEVQTAYKDEFDYDDYDNTEGIIKEGIFYENKIKKCKNMKKLKKYLEKGYNLVEINNLFYLISYN